MLQIPWICHNIHIHLWQVIMKRSWEMLWCLQLSWSVITHRRLFAYFAPWPLSLCHTGSHSGYWLPELSGIIKNVTADAALHYLLLHYHHCAGPWAGGWSEVMTVSNTTTMSDLCRQYFIIIWFIWFFTPNESSLVTCNKDNDEKGGGEDTLTSLLLTVNMYTS